MSDKENNKIVESSNDQKCNDVPVIDETVTAHMMQIFGNQSQQYMPTQSQVDKVLDLQAKGMEYTHEERTKFSPIQKTELTVIIVVIITFLIIFTLSIFFAKEYVGEIIYGMIGILTGGLGGYGLGRSKKDDDNSDRE
ncbi:MAG: hypothetical protein KAT32_00565 [Candidatus Moranbacteria bacterium]|nr:hypothetical protein [Candidatus Moranbacteria bacterium]